jgi:transposase InsO family protein
MKYTGPYTGVICGHCQKRHRKEDCWKLYPEKRPQHGGYAQKETTEKELDTRPKAHSAVAAVAHAEGWLLDSAASFHMAREEPDVVDKSRGGKRIRTANGQVISCVGIGQMSVGDDQVILKNVRHVPGLEMNLMSISALCADGWRLVFEENRVVVSRAGQSMTVSSHGGVYPVAAAVSVARTDVEKAAPAGPWIKERLVHDRMGHLNQEFVRLLPKATNQAFRIRYEKRELCEPCVIAKQRRRPNRQPAERAKRPGQRIHADLCGGGYTFASKELQQTDGFEALPASESGAKFFIVMTDDFSRYRKTVPLKHKNKAEEAMEEFISEIEAKGHRIEAIRKDGGTEFSSKKFEKWLKKKGIQIEDSALYTPEQNGLSERSVGLVCAKARSMLLATDLP